MKKNFGVKNWMFPMPVLMIGTYMNTPCWNVNWVGATALWNGIQAGTSWIANAA